jgi:fatty-acid peroxygenase
MSFQSVVAKIPHRAHFPDDTLTFVLGGYTFIGDRCRELDTDLFETRLLLQRTICMLGAEAARLFYGEHMQRAGAAPHRVQTTLFGRGGVQALDGEAHRARKHLFIELLSPIELQRLSEMLLAELRAHEWSERVALFDVAQDILARVVCAWAGVPLEEERRIRDIAAMIDAAGGIGPRNWRGRIGRARAESWVMRQLEEVRAQRLPATGALKLFAETDLDTRTAAVELLNVIRPTVAVAYYMTFCAVALHEFPHMQELAANDSLVEPFVQEVRRFYPFFPAVAARVRQELDWHDVHFATGTRVLLDLYGTNHDPRIWEAPDRFRPERFVGWDGDPFTLIPQGGGDTATGHRCPGERLTIELMKTTVRFLTREIGYDVPAQDLHVSLARMPTLPASRFVIANVRTR